MENGNLNWTIQHVWEGAFQRFKKNAGGYLVLGILELLAFFSTAFLGDLGLIAQFVLLPIWAGYFLAFRAEKDKTTTNSFTHFFDGFKRFKKFFSLGFLLFLFIFLPIGLLFTLGVMNEGIDPYSLQNPNKLTEILESGVLTPYFVAGFANMGVFMSIYIIAYPISVEFDVSAWKAMETSRKVFAQSSGKFILLSVFIGSMLLISMMFMLIPLLITIPIIRCLQQEIFELSKVEIVEIIEKG